MLPRLTHRPLSWSQISSFQYNPEQWYSRYILGEREASTPAMEFGKFVGEKLASDSLYLPPIPRGERFEYKLEAKLGEIPLIGYIDSYTPHSTLLEYKTHGKNGWNQKRVDEHGQITMYCLMLHLIHKIKPKDLKITLVAIKTKENSDFSFSLADTPPITFETRRSMQDIMQFGNTIKKTLGDMEKFAKQKCNSG